MLTTSAFKAQSSTPWIAACLLGLSALLSGAVEAAEVESVSNDVFEHQGENAYWQATVKCEGSSVSIPIRQELKQTSWCSENSAVPCAESKLRMAEQVCLNIEAFAPARPVSPAPSTPTSTAPTSTATTNSSTSTSAAQREADRRTRQQEQEKAQALAGIEAEDRQLQQQRRQLEADQRALTQAERELDQAERQLEAQLRALEN